jgi:hypothetical protein
LKKIKIPFRNQNRRRKTHPQRKMKTTPSHTELPRVIKKNRLKLERSNQKWEALLVVEADQTKKKGTIRNKKIRHTS